MENSHLDCFFSNFLFFKIFFGFFKRLASNAQVNPNIEKRQLPGNGAKNLLGKTSSFRFINPKCKVVPLSTQGIVHWELGFKYWD